MNEFTATLLAGLARTTVQLSVAATVAFFLLRGLRCRSPALHRAAWIAVLLTGWLLVRATATIPWYDAPPIAFRSLPAPTSEVIEAAQAAQPLPVASPVAVLPSKDAPVAAEAPRLAAVAWAVVLAAAWVLGGLAIVAYWLIGYIRFVRALPFGLSLTDQWRAEWQDALAECAVRRPVRLCVTEGTDTLVCRAWGGYRVLVPAPLWRELSSPERRLIVRHELAHVRRGDLVLSLVARCLAIPHWFNPLAWWAVRNVDECGEWACDDAIRRRQPADAPAYARVLLRLGQDVRRPHFGAAIGGRRLSTRIRRMLTEGLPEDSIMKRCVLISSVGLLVFAGAIDWRLGPRGAGADELEVEATRGEPNVDRALLERMVHDAANTYRATRAAYLIGEEIVANVYVWSRRWLDAERALAKSQADEITAARAHRERIKKLFLRVNTFYTLGMREGEAPKFFATKYYLDEANIWLATAKSHGLNQPAPIKNVSVSFGGPPGMTVAWEEKGQGIDSEPLASPGAHDFAEGQIYRLRMASFRDAADLKLLGTLELTTARGQNVPVEISLAEVKTIVLNNTGLTKVFYRAGDSHIGTVSGEWDKGDRSKGRWDSGEWDKQNEQLAAEAEGRGEVLAILRLWRGS